jgi:16S rRNA (guanine527-N7)-methyltransferase
MVVSRETPAPPPAAGEVFGADLPLAMRYAELLVGAGVERGLIGPREADRIWDRHLLNCAVVAPAIPSGATVYDVGSGAGLPGIVLAIVRPDLRLLLVEPLERRATFLAEVIDLLGLEQVEVCRARADEVRAPAADVVVARAVAPLDRLAGWCLPMVRPDGAFLAMKGARAADELAAAEPVLTRLGATAWRIEQMGLDVIEHPTTVVVVTAGGPAPRQRGRDRAGTVRGQR